MGSIATEAIQKPSSWDLAWARIYGGLLAAAGAYGVVIAITEWHWDSAWSFSQRFVQRTEDVIFLFASLALTTSGIGLMRLRVWGWYGAVGILTFVCALSFLGGLLTIGTEGCLTDFGRTCLDLSLLLFVLPAAFYYMLVQRQLLESSHRSCYRAEGLRVRGAQLLSIALAGTLVVLIALLGSPYQSSFPGIP